MTTRHWGGAFALLTAGLFVATHMPACRNAQPPTTDGSPDPGDGSDLTPEPGSLDAWLATVSSESYSGDHATEPPIYASDLIRRQFENDAITESEYFVQSARAAFQPDLLDTAYHAERDPGIDPTVLLRRTRLAWDRLSPEAQAELQPYLLSCDDPDSFWYDAHQSSARAITPTARVLDMENPRPDGSYWRITGPADSDDRQALVGEALAYAYERFADLGFPEPTEWIRVSLRESLSSPDYYGEQFMAHIDGTDRCHILLRSTLDDDVLRSTTAHELFHCFQDYVTADVSVSDAGWVWESSAVWSEEFVYPDINREHEYDAQFFENLNDYFFDALGTLEYAAYMYWFFIDQRAGKTGEAARDLFFDIYANGTLEAITGRPNFYAEFKDYALWNLNMSPFKFYEDFGGEPSGRPSGFSFSQTQVDQGYRTYGTMSLDEGGIAYYLYTFDDLVDKVVFDMHEIKKTEANQIGVQIVYRIDGNWTHEDVSARDEFSFCRSRPHEDLDAIIFIVSNGNLDFDDPSARFNGELVIDATQWCAPSWHGEVVCEFNRNGQSYDPSQWGCLGAYRNSGTRRLEQNLIFDDDSGRFYVADYTASEYANYHWYCEPEPSAVADVVGYVAWEKEEYSIALSETVVLDIPDECPPDCFDVSYSIERSDEDPRTYELRSRHLGNVGDYTSTYSMFDVPGSLGLMQGHVPHVETDIDYHTLSITIPPEPMTLTMSEQGTLLTGSYVDENWTCRAEFLFE
ncbi:MAG: hypothetical protein H6817_07265 [Phycisphaerales bacterium]|nr:hypothetical protein [Phycisphaerales bacterium]